MKLVHTVSLLTLLLLLLTTGCQNSPPQSSEAIIFDESEVIEVAEDSGYQIDYLLPKIHQSPLQIHDDVWERVTGGFQLDYQQDKPRIESQMNWYIRNPAYLDRVNTRASRYLWHIVEELDKRDMPMEIALLPIVESAFDPFAYSHARASGMWQFIPATGTFMGLKRDWWYDGRRDVVASTNAALNLLQRLHDRLDNDWLLALAAYNSGEGNVRKAIRRNKRNNKPTDFWHLKLPKETKAYVPKLLALARLYKNPQKYNTYILPIANKPYFKVTNTDSQIDLAQAAKLAEINIDEIYLLNPGLNRWATRPNGPHQILLPVENAKTFRLALQTLPLSQRVSWQQYTILPGDSLSLIAANFNVSTKTLASVNRLKNNNLRAGKTLMIPVASGDNYSLSQNQRSEKVQRMLAKIDSPKIIHKVKSGESLWTISRKYKTTPKKVARWNGMATRDTLRIGKKLIIWKKGTPVIPKATAATEAALNIQIPERQNPASADKKIRYKVRRGDSLGAIANKFNTSVKNITRWNKINTQKIIRPGQLLIIYTDLANAR